MCHALRNTQVDAPTVPSAVIEGQLSYLLLVYVSFHTCVT
jgi:hypothetical protein